MQPVAARVFMAKRTYVRHSGYWLNPVSLFSLCLMQLTPAREEPEGRRASDAKTLALVRRVRAGRQHTTPEMPVLGSWPPDGGLQTPVVRAIKGSTRQ